MNRRHLLLFLIGVPLPIIILVLIIWWTFLSEDGPMSAKHPRTAVKIAYLPIDLSKFDGGRH